MAMKRRIALALLLVGFLAACGSDAPLQIYTLYPVEASAIDNRRMAIAVQGVDVPRYLDRPQLIRLQSAYQYQVADIERWGEAFADMTTRVLIEDLVLRMPRAQVFQDVGSTAVPAQYVLEVSLSRFEADPSNVVQLAARWVLRGGQDNEVKLASGVLVSQPATGAATAAIVQAMSLALAQLADAIVASVP